MNESVFLRKRFKKHNKEMFCFANNFAVFFSIVSQWRGNVSSTSQQRTSFLEEGEMTPKSIEHLQLHHISRDIIKNRVKFYTLAPPATS